MRSLRFLAAATLPLSLGPIPVASAQVPCHDLGPLGPIVQDAVSTLRLAGASLRVDQHGTNIYEQAFGRYGLDQVVLIASATKWYSAVLLMSLVDSGKVALDDRVATYVPSFTGAKATITVRQCFTHTSGLPQEDDSLGNTSITLAQSADLIAQRALLYAPGTAFAYGGASMQVAGRVCEVAGGKPWATLFTERVAIPLGLANTDYGASQNPRVAGGARSTLRDYARLIEMLRTGGVFNQTRVLSAASVAEMFRDHTGTLRVINSPHPNGAPYGIGTWLDRLDANGRPLQVSGAGAFGFSGWLDLERDAGGVLVVQDLFTRIWPYLDAMQGVTRDALKPVGIACTGTSTPACAGPIWTNANSQPRAGSPAFGLFCSGAPPATAGVLALATRADPTGTPVLGIRLFLPLDPPPVLLPVTTGATGRSSLPVPLTGLPAGLPFAWQYVWVNTPSCGAPAPLSASHANEAKLGPP